MPAEPERGPGAGVDPAPVRPYGGDVRFFDHGRRGVLAVNPVTPGWAVVNAAAVRLIAMCDGRADARAVARRFATQGGVAPARARAAVAALGKAGVLARSMGALDPVAPNAPPVHGAFLELTLACNLRCRTCSAAAGVARGAELGEAELRGLAAELSSLGGRLLTLSGGEPLLSPHLFAVLDECRRRGLKAAMFTNGALMTAALARRIARRDVHVRVSVDAPAASAHDANRGRGSFAAALRAVCLLQAAGHHDLALSFTPTGRTAAAFPDMVELCLALGVSILHVSFFEPVGRAKADPRLDLTPAQRRRLLVAANVARWTHPAVAIAGILDAADRLAEPPERRFGCSLGKTLKVTPSGDIYPCAVLCETLGPSRFRIGRVGAGGLGAALQGDAMNRLREVNWRRWRPGGPCAGCTWAFWCRGGCMARAYIAGGALDARWEYCAAVDAAFREAALRLAGGGGGGRAS